MPSELLTERRGASLVLTIAGAPTRNSLSDQVCTAGVEALDVAESDNGIRCIVLRGDGEHFSSGANLEQLCESTAPGELGAASQRLEHLQRFIEAIRAFPRPVIAAVEGAATGSGFALALACDMLVAAEDACFMPTRGDAGLSPDGGCSWLLMQALPRPLALQMMWSAEPCVDAAQLHRLGLVGRVVPKGRALEAALAAADGLSRMAPNVLASVKELVYQLPARGLSEQMAIEAEHFMANLRHPNALEGLSSVMQERPAQFTGDDV